MSLKDKEKRVREERIIEASRKGLLGLEGKFGIIITNLGQPIISQNTGGGLAGGMYSSNQIDLGHEKEDEDDLPTVQFEQFGDIKDPTGSEWTPKKGTRDYASISQIGWHFDGLSRGIHIEIWYSPESHELKVTYKGFLVYKDIKSEVQAYAPFPEWENKIDQLYDLARKAEKVKREGEKKERIEEANKKKLSWLQRFRLQWGI
jgi:hypothetical protein